MPTHCPTCGHLVTPVYGAASTPERPLMLAWTQRQAAGRLGTSESTLRPHLVHWCDGWRLVRQAPPAPVACRWCGERRIWRRSALANHERWCSGERKAA